MYLGFIIYISIIAVIAAFILSKKFRCFFVAVILFALIVFGACALQNAAKADEIKHGIITRVTPELFNNYPVLVITVETSTDKFTHIALKKRSRYKALLS